MRRTGGGRPPLTPAAWLRWDAIRRALDDSRPGRVLEVGAGEGAVGRRLAERYDYVGLEPDPRSRAVAERRLAALGRGLVLGSRAADFRPEAPFDLVCAFEVLEHQSDDVAELRRWRAFLRPGGRLLLSVPAHPDRFGPSDRAVGHHRRYARADLLRALDAAGFESLRIDAWGAGLGHVLEWGRHRIAARQERRGQGDGAEPAPHGGPSPAESAAGTAGSGRWLQPRGPVLGWVAAAVAAPFRLLQAPLRDTDVGIGWVVLARRRE